jgi:hypothetical protein
MNKMTWLKSASAALLAAMLAACGGGGGTTSTPLPEVAWASPAAFVPPGSSSKVFKLLSGDFKGACYRSNDGEESSSELHSPTLVITSAGDVSMLAASVQGNTPTVQFEVKFADLSFSSFRASGTAETPSFSLQLLQLGRSVKYLNVDSDEDGRSSLELGIEGEDESSFDIECDMVDTLVLQVQPTAARVAKNLGTESGAKTYDDYYFEGGISAEFAMWSYGNQMISSLEAPQGSNEGYSYRANLKTGELALLTNAASATYAPISLDLPSGAQQNSGHYEEGVCRQSVFFDYKEAKSLSVYRSDLNGPPIGISRYGDKFMPQPSFPLSYPCVQFSFGFRP